MIMRPTHLPVCEHPEHADYEGREWVSNTGMNRMCWLYWNYPRAKAAADKAAAAPKTLVKVPNYGPGTEAMALTKLLGIEACSACELRAAQMNIWGVEGCRKNRALIVSWFAEASASRSWMVKVKAGVRAVSQPWFDPLDPFGCIVDEAIRVAEAKGVPE